LPEPVTPTLFPSNSVEGHFNASIVDLQQSELTELVRCITPLLDRLLNVMRRGHV
jgi:hypothetical protein